MARRLFTALSVQSLVVFLVTVTLWARSFVRTDSVVLDTGSKLRLTLLSCSGEFWVVRSWVGSVPPQLSYQSCEPKYTVMQTICLIPVSLQPVPGAIGFRYGRDPGVLASAAAGIPARAVALMLLVLPLVWVFRRGRRALRLAGARCASCGYNLTGNASGVCPECGTPTAAGVKA